MSRSITLGQYLPGDSLIHRLNPRLKILNLVVVLVLLFALESFPGLLVLLGIALFLYILAGIPFRYILRGLRPIIFIILFALIVYFFFTGGGVVLFRLGIITIETEGVRQGTFIVTRLVILILFSLLLTLTTTPLSLSNAIGFYLKPFRYVGLPAEEVAMIMTIALRFIPTLMEESQRLMRAQTARGADFESGSFFQRAKNLVPLIVPLFISAFRRADDLALAMEARGYRIGAERSSLYEDVIMPRDWGSFAFILILLVVALTLGL
ncbi:MAG: energy-coupling factor transporter transmembrane protein EcfT [Bacillota bacterium]